MRFDVREKYKDKIVVDEYDKKRFSSVTGRFVNRLEKGFIEKAINYIGLPKGARILDLPCGTGRISILLAKKGYLVVGADISEEMVIKSSNNAKENGLLKKVQFKVLDAEKIPYPNDSFDAVVSLRFFGHTPPKVRGRILNEFARVARTYFVLVYSRRNSLQEILRRGRRLSLDIPWYPASIDEIRSELGMVGIREMKIFPLLGNISESIVVIGKKIYAE